MPNPRLPVPKLERSARAKPARIASPMAATIQVPIFDFDTRRKKESIGVPVRMEVAGRLRSRAGVHQAAPLGRAKERVGMALKKLVAGNWKMHGLSSDIEEIRVIAEAAGDYPK